MFRISFRTKNGKSLDINIRTVVFLLAPTSSTEPLQLACSRLIIDTVKGCKIPLKLNSGCGCSKLHFCVFVINFEQIDTVLSAALQPVLNTNLSMIYAKYCSSSGYNVIHQVVILIHILIIRVVGMSAALHLPADVSPDGLLLQEEVHQTHGRARGTGGQSRLSLCLVCRPVPSARPQLRRYLR